MSERNPEFGAVSLALSAPVLAFLRRWPYHLIDRFNGAKGRGAEDIHTLEITLFDVIRQVTTGANMGRLFAVRTAHHDFTPYGCFFCASALARAILRAGLLKSFMSTPVSAGR